VNRWSDDAWARRYLAERDGIPHRMEGFAVLAEMLPPSPRRVLDLGTGDGYALGLVRRIRPGVDGVGIDFNPDMLARARARFEGDTGIDFVEGDLDHPLPEDLGTFDVVVSSFAIHHCGHERKRGIYGEVFTILERGGMFLNLEHVDSPTPELHEAFLHAIGKTVAEDDPSNQLLDVETQLRWLRETGFTHVDCYWKWRELALLSGVKPGS
jgi:tRNA (cmo5U34)-methyltransferase